MANSGELDQTVPYESTLFALTYQSEKYYSNLKKMFRKVFHRTGFHIYYQFVWNSNKTLHMHIFKAKHVLLTLPSFARGFDINVLKLASENAFLWSVMD